MSFIKLKQILLEELKQLVEEHGLESIRSEYEIEEELNEQELMDAILSKELENYFV